MSSTDRIEKRVLIRAPQIRVWRALTNAKAFGTWFLARLEGDFEVGAHISGKSTHPACEDLAMDLWIEKMDAEHYFSFRWRPDDVDPATSPEGDVTTLVEFRLERVPEGTLLTVVESGFDRLSPERREKAVRLNTEGWREQMENISRYVTE